MNAFLGLNEVASLVGSDVPALLLLIESGRLPWAQSYRGRTFFLRSDLQNIIQAVRNEAVLAIPTPSLEHFEAATTTL